MSPNQVKAAKTLLIILPLAIGVMAFQNCAPANFQSSGLSSKGERILGQDVAPDSEMTGTAPLPEPGTSIGPLPATGTGTSTLPDTLPMPGTIVIETPVLAPPTTGSNLAANCKLLRDKFLVDHALPENKQDELKTKGQEVVSRFIHSSSTEESVGGSALYLVGDNAEALVGHVIVKGTGHIVLCGLNAQIASTVGTAVLDVIGGSILEGSVAKGQSKINVYTLSGEPK